MHVYIFSCFLLFKVCRKLQGKGAGSASWCTNVGNERGEVLISVLTEGESTESLQPLADGLVERYQISSKAPLACSTQTGTAARSTVSGHHHSRQLLLLVCPEAVCW